MLILVKKVHDIPHLLDYSEDRQGGFLLTPDNLYPIRTQPQA